MTRKSKAEAAVMAVMRDQIEAGIRAAEPIAVQRAKDQVVRAAMRWLRKFDSDIDYSDSPLLWPQDHALMRTCERLARLAAQRKKGK